MANLFYSRAQYTVLWTLSGQSGQDTIVFTRHLDTSGQWTPQHGDWGESLGPSYFISIHSRKLPPVGTTDPTNQTHYNTNEPKTQIVNFN